MMIKANVNNNYFYFYVTIPSIKQKVKAISASLHNTSISYD